MDGVNKRERNIDTTTHFPISWTIFVMWQLSVNDLNLNLFKKKKIEFMLKNSLNALKQKKKKRNECSKWWIVAQMDKNPLEKKGVKDRRSERKRGSEKELMKKQ